MNTDLEHPWSPEIVSTVRVVRAECLLQRDPQDKNGVSPNGTFHLLFYDQNGIPITKQEVLKAYCDKLIKCYPDSLGINNVVGQHIDLAIQEDGRVTFHGAVCVTRLILDRIRIVQNAAPDSPLRQKLVVAGIMEVEEFTSSSVGFVTAAQIVVADKEPADSSGALNGVRKSSRKAKVIDSSKSRNESDVKQDEIKTDVSKVDPGRKSSKIVAFPNGGKPTVAGNPNAEAVRLRRKRTSRQVADGTYDLS